LKGAEFRSFGAAMCGVSCMHGKEIPLPLLFDCAASLYVSGKMPTYPSPKALLTLTSHLG